MTRQIFGVIEKLSRACHFQTALETMLLLPILIVLNMVNI